VNDQKEVPKKGRSINQNYAGGKPLREARSRVQGGGGLVSSQLKRRKQNRPCDAWKRSDNLNKLKWR